MYIYNIIYIYNPHLLCNHQVTGTRIPKGQESPFGDFPEDYARWGL